MMILTLALVIPEREVFECVRGDSMLTSLGKILLIAHIRLRSDGEVQVQTIPKQVLRIQLQPRERIVEVPIVLHFVQLVENPQL